MLSKRVVVQQREVLEDGTIQIRFSKQVLDDDKVLLQEYHRTVLHPGGDLDALMKAVNESLEGTGWPACEDYSSVARLLPIEHTETAIAAFAAKNEAQRDSEAR